MAILRTVIAFLLVLSFGLASASGQVLDFSFDLNTPASHARNQRGMESLDVNAEIAFGLSYYSRSMFAQDLDHRWGIVVGRQGLKVTPGPAGGKSATYTTFNVQAGVDWRLAGNSRYSLTAGVVGGLSFMSNSVPCNEVFCNLPESVVLFTPSLKLATRISSRVSGVLETKGVVYMTDSESTFPYRSGVIVAVGLEVLSTPRKVE